MTYPNVRVYCPVCKGGDNIIWEGTMVQWLNQLSKILPPPWFNYAMNHQEAHDHTVMVTYPTLGDIPLGEAAKL